MEASPERPDAVPRVQLLLLALSLLTLVTGLVDAACYLGLVLQPHLAAADDAAR